MASHRNHPSSSSSSSDDDVPVYLMPVAAVLGVYTLYGLGRTIYWIYNSSTTRRDENGASKSSRTRRTTAALAAVVDENTKNTTLLKVGSPAFLRLVVSWMVAAVAYSMVVAVVERSLQQADYSRFDPYEILGLDVASRSNATLIKKAYRDLAKIHHPDQYKPNNNNDVGKNKLSFVRLTQAHMALTDEVGMRNYATYGHPDGPLSTPIFQMAVPQWLLFPRGKIAGVMLFLYLSMLGGAFVYYIIIQRQQQRVASAADSKCADENSQTKVPLSLLDDNHSVGLDDMSYLARTLKPDSTPWDVLTATLATPETIQWSLLDLERVEKARQHRIERDRQLLKENIAKNKTSASHTAMDVSAFDDLVNEGGWDEEDDADMAAKAAAAEAERKKELEQLKQQATGQVVLLLEGMDEGVLGQKWVEATLTKAGVWPPQDLGVLAHQMFDYEGRQVSALDHPGVRRILCMTVGRLNSIMLNGHQDLLEAGSKERIDQTYFRASMEFRNRVGMLLEAALRVAIAMGSKRLLSTIIETVAMYKIGVNKDKKSIPWFNQLMTRQYGILPRLKVHSKTVATPDQVEIATGDSAEVQLDLERIHAENFLKVKVEMFKQQGIPPQVGLQSYREGWWFLLRMKRLDGVTVTEPILAADVPWTVESADVSVFEKENPENRLLTAWPMIMQNIAQQRGKAKIQFKAPAEAGKYRYYVGIQSQDFFGADQELEFDVDVLDATTVHRQPKKDSTKEEPKKEK